MENQRQHALIQTLLDCAITCENCLSACLLEENLADMTRCTRLNRDCADICFQTAKSLQRQAENDHQYLLICEDICRKCAEECAKHQQDYCRLCAQSCLACAQVCHEHRHLIMQD